MGKGFGELYKMRGIVMYSLSPYEQKAFANAISKGVPNVIRRCKASFLYVVPPFALGYLIYDQANREHARLLRKNPADFENDQ